jgi:AcrR family transcriptional regulator
MADSKNAGKASEIASRRQRRSHVTREELIHSARYIFARDGFEHARLEDIAARAGKTRGAFYANFRDKEDVFCAIFEEDIDRDMVKIAPLLLSLPSTERRIDVLADFLSQLSKDRQRTLLNLEFKLYAIRHPRRRKRLADLHAAMRLRCIVPELVESDPEAGLPCTDERISGSLALGGVLDGLALNHLFDPDALDSEELAHYLKICVREALHAPTAKLC